MRRCRFSEEQIVAIVRESHAHGVAATARQHKVSEHKIYNWRRKFGEMDPNQVAELNWITQGNARLKKLLAECDLEIEVMQETTSKKEVGVSRRVEAVERAQERGLGQGRAYALFVVYRSMLTHQPKKLANDARVLAVINDVIEKHPAWGVSPIHDWVCANDHEYTEGCIRRLYRQAGQLRSGQKAAAEGADRRACSSGSRSGTRCLVHGLCRGSTHERTEDLRPGRQGRGNSLRPGHPRGPVFQRR